MFARNADLSLAPASNEKLPVTSPRCASSALSYRFRTEVLGARRAGRRRLARRPVPQGLRRPDADDARARAACARDRGRRDHARRRTRCTATSRGSTRSAPRPAGSSAYLIYECPPLSALVVDRGVLRRHTSRASRRSPPSGRFRRLLRGYGVTTGPVGLGRAPAAATLLATSRVARRCANVIAVMDRESDNFRAEMLLKELGAESRARRHERRRRRRRPPRPRRGGHAARGRRDRRRLGPVAPRPADRRRRSRRILDHRVERPRAQDPVLDGAARRRRAGHARAPAGRRRRARGVVHAKTGTTNEASALSGYVRDRFAFVVDPERRAGRGDRGRERRRTASRPRSRGSQLPSRRSRSASPSSGTPAFCGLRHLRRPGSRRRRRRSSSSRRCRRPSRRAPRASRAPPRATSTRACP